MRRLLVGILTAATFAVASAPAFGHPPPNHLHCLTTPSGKTHAIARGVTLHAPHDTAFHNFHQNVHREVFGVTEIGLAGKHPLGPMPANLPYDPANPPC